MITDTYLFKMHKKEQRGVSVGSGLHVKFINKKCTQSHTHIDSRRHPWISFLVAVLLCPLLAVCIRNTGSTSPKVAIKLCGK